MPVIQITKTNSFIIYNSFRKRDLSHKEFILPIIKSPIENHKFMSQNKIE